MNIDDVKRSLYAETNDSDYKSNLKYYEMEKNNILKRKNEIIVLINSYVDKGMSETDYDYQKAFKEFQKINYELKETEKILKYLRPNNQYDIEYRKRQLNEFTKKLRSVISDKLDLRFHGAPIYFAEDIISSGKISSTAERFNGYNRSFDSAGIISVTDIDSLDTTVKSFSGLDFSDNLPAGCIFILRTENTDTCKEAFSMKSVDFKENPKALYGIITTPENINMVRGWMLKQGFMSEKVYDFDEFIHVIEQEKFKQKRELLTDIKSDYIDQESIIKEALEERKESIMDIDKRDNIGR